MMLAFNVDRTGLWTLVTGSLGKMDPVPRLQVIEICIEHAIAMKIDFPAIKRLYHAVILFRYQSGNLTMWFGNMLLNIAMKTPVIVFQLTACCIKGIANGDIDVLVGVAIVRLARDHDFLTWQGDIYMDRE
jgi:hypothetical protein